MNVKQLKYPKTPELDKALSIKDKSQVIGEFIDWLKEKNIYLKTPIEEENEHGDKQQYWVYPFENLIKLLHQFFEIDENKCEEERVAILEYIRSKPTTVKNNKTPWDNSNCFRLSMDTYPQDGDMYFCVSLNKLIPVPQCHIDEGYNLNQLWAVWGTEDVSDPVFVRPIINPVK